VEALTAAGDWYYSFPKWAESFSKQQGNLGALSETDSWARIQIKDHPVRIPG
jgi:hypothetical protein